MVCCVRCGKALSDPESVKRGYGPECAEQIRRDYKIWLSNDFGHPRFGEINDVMDEVLSRNPRFEDEMRTVREDAMA